MSRGLMKRCLIVTILFCLLTVWIDIRIALGFLLGAVGSVVLYLRSVVFCDIILSEKSTRHLKTFGRFMQSYAIMAIVLIISAVKPELFNVFASAAGLLMVKFCLILETLTERRGKNEHSTSSDNSK
ncbi:MAG: hypothetical protein IJ356_03450 [Erysipelotrichaceae bacterium]|nr:hypothetical protein [Erysipelotrichaceae bacterium]